VASHASVRQSSVWSCGDREVRLSENRQLKWGHVFVPQTLMTLNVKIIYGPLKMELSKFVLFALRTLRNDAVDSD